MKKTTILLGVLFTLFSVGAFAQHEVLNPDPDPGGSGGGGSCYTCGISDNGNATCSPLYNDPAAWMDGMLDQFHYRIVYGYSSCIGHNIPGDQQGPNYCTMSGSCGVAQEIKNVTIAAGSEIVMEAAGIEKYLRDSGVLSDADLNDFIAVTDFALRGEPYAVAAEKRLAAYRAEFNRLIARGDPLRELKPGSIPVMPHKLTKVPATVTASR